MTMTVSAAAGGFQKEAVGLDREQHPGGAAGIAILRDPHRLPDTFGANYRGESGGAVSHFDSDLYHFLNFSL